MNQKKVLFVTDDVRVQTGVAIQAYKLMKGLVKTGEWDVVTMAGSRSQPDLKPTVFDGIKLYPVGNGYGDPNSFRVVMQAESPDAVVFFSDPRFFTWAFTMDDEYRHRSRVVFYHTWDNAPVPLYNKTWYSACDRIVMLSRFSHRLLSEGGIPCDCIPHGGDPGEFFPFTAEQRKEAQDRIFRNLPWRPEITFFYNNRNIHRKRTADVILAFKRFQKRHPKSVLLMNTAVVDADGNDLAMVLKQVEPSDAVVVINQAKVPSEELNKMYNVADATFNVAVNEGFGLSCMESLLAGTPNIATATGGLTEQMTDGKETFGFLLKPEVQTLFGIPGNPYIYQDWVSMDAIGGAMEKAWELSRQGAIDGTDRSELERLGALGREHIVANYNIKQTVSAWDALLRDVLDKPSKWERISLTTL